MDYLFMVANTYQATLASELQLELGRSMLREVLMESMVMPLTVKLSVVMPTQVMLAISLVTEESTLRTPLATMLSLVTKEVLGASMPMALPTLEATHEQMEVSVLGGVAGRVGVQWVVRIGQDGYPLTQHHCIQIVVRQDML